MKKHAAERNEDGSVDILSKLPEHILNQILCFLPQKEAVQTCVLSKSWRYRGSTRTKLELCQRYDFKRDEQSFFTVVENSLQRYNDQNLCAKQLILKMYKVRKGSLKYDLPSLALKPEFLQELYLDGFLLRHVNCTDHQYFPSLKSLFLKYQRMSSESFVFFTSNYMPSLEKLELKDCYGFDEFKISSFSIKHLKIIRVGLLIKSTIDVPNLVYFKLKVFYPPSLYFTPISSEWKFHINLPFMVYRNSDNLPRLLELNEVLEALTQSQVTLQLQNYSRMWNHNLSIEDTAYAGFFKPLVVENLRLRGFQSSPIAPVIFNNFFRVCRPRYIYDVDFEDNRELTEILSKVLLHERERRDYFWNKDLVDVGMETSCDYANEWHPTHANSLSECALPDKQMIRLRLKWKE